MNMTKHLLCLDVSVGVFTACKGLMLVGEINNMFY